MKLPIRFPSEANKLHEEAEACRRLSVAERIRAIGRLTRACRALGGQSSEIGSRLRDEGHGRLKKHLQEMAKRNGTG